MAKAEEHEKEGEHELEEVGCWEVGSGFCGGHMMCVVMLGGGKSDSLCKFEGIPQARLVDMFDVRTWDGNSLVFRDGHHFSSLFQLEARGNPERAKLGESGESGD